MHERCPPVSLHHVPCEPHGDMNTVKASPPDASTHTHTKVTRAFRTPCGPAYRASRHIRHHHWIVTTHRPTKAVDPLSKRLYRSRSDTCSLSGTARGQNCCTHNQLINYNSTGLLNGWHHLVRIRRNNRIRSTVEHPNREGHEAGRQFVTRRQRTSNGDSGLLSRRRDQGSGILGSAKRSELRQRFPRQQPVGFRDPRFWELHKQRAINTRDKTRSESRAGDEPNSVPCSTKGWPPFRRGCH
jgi:hypothetical protein